MSFIRKLNNIIVDFAIIWLISKYTPSNLGKHRHYCDTYWIQTLPTTDTKCSQQYLHSETKQWCVALKWTIVHQCQSGFRQTGKQNAPTATLRRNWGVIHEQGAYSHMHLSCMYCTVSHSNDSRNSWSYWQIHSRVAGLWGSPASALFSKSHQKLLIGPHQNWLAN